MSEPQIMGYTEKYVDGLKKQLTALQSELASAERVEAPTRESD